LQPANHPVRQSGVTQGIAVKGSLAAV